MKKLIKNFLMKFTPLFGLYFNKKTKGRELFLTFDDGPHPQVTRQLLSLLKQHQAKVTFFVVGREAEKNPELLNEIVAEGHSLDNHSYNHTRFASLPLSEQLKEVQNTNQIIRQITDIHCKLFRAPQGFLSVKLLKKLKQMGCTTFNWSYDSLDCYDNSSNDVISVCEKYKVKGGDILLFHDDNEKVIPALEYLLPYWQQMGFVFGTL